jgi:hypothetical protein
MKTRTLPLLFPLLLLVGACSKEGIGGGRGPRIHRISQERDGRIQYDFEFFYTPEGLVKQILIIDQTSYAKSYFFSHTPGTSTRRYMDEEGRLYDIDSVILNTAGKPLSKWKYQDRKWQLESRYTYSAAGELLQIETERRNNPDSVSYFPCYHTDGNLVRIEDKLDVDEVYAYYTDKPTQVAGVDMLDVLFTRGRVLLPYKHLIKSRGYEGSPATQRYEYEWQDSRIATVKYTTGSNTVTLQRITYEK